MRAARIGVLLCGAVLLFIAEAAAQDGPSFDCRRAGTAVEKALCASRDLGQRDATLAKLYRDARKRLDGSTLSSFARNQTQWISERNRMCESGDPACLAALYDDRIEAFRALLARTSDENPDLDDREPAALSGDWIVESVGSAPAGLTPLSVRLPPVGAHLSVRPDEFCVIGASGSRDCRKFALAVEAADNPVTAGSRATLAADSNSTLMLTYFDGRADFELVSLPKSAVGVVFLACARESKRTDCKEEYQRWQPFSPDARFRVFRLF